MWLQLNELYRATILTYMSMRHMSKSLLLLRCWRCRCFIRGCKKKGCGTRATTFFFPFVSLCARWIMWTIFIRAHFMLLLVVILLLRILFSFFVFYSVKLFIRFVCGARFYANVYGFRSSSTASVHSICRFFSLSSRSSFALFHNTFDTPCGGYGWRCCWSLCYTFAMQTRTDEDIRCRMQLTDEEPNHAACEYSLLFDVNLRRMVNDAREMWIFSIWSLH